MIGDSGNSALMITCRACPTDLAEVMLPLLSTAARNLDLEDSLREVVLCVDDLQDDDAGWLRIDPVARSERPRLTLYCGCAALTARTPGGLPAGEETYVWDLSAPEAIEVAVANLDPATATVFLHHQLLLARDLLRCELSPALVPAGLAEAFAAAWDVSLDGRLARAGLPGYALKMRRARFSSLFSSASVLMPHHWQIFQSLWEGGLTTQAAVMAAVRQLPRL